MDEDDFKQRFSGEPPFLSHLSFSPFFSLFFHCIFRFLCAFPPFFSFLFPVLQVCFCLFFLIVTLVFLFFFCLSSCFNLGLSFFSLFVVVLSFSLPFSSFSSAFFPDFRSDKSGIFWHGIVFYFVYKVLVFSLLYFTYTHFAQIFPKTCHFFVALCFYIII